MKRLPPGTWITLNSLTPGTTDADVQEFLRQAGVELPIDNIDVNQNQKGAQAIISLLRNDVTILFDRAIQGLELRGRTPAVVYRTVASAGRYQ